MSSDRTEQPTPRRRREARKDGQVPRTPELGGWAAVLLFALVAEPLVRRELGALSGIMVTSLRTLEDPEPAKALTLLGSGMAHVLLVLVLLGVGVLLVGVTGALSQGGFFVATRAVKPKLSKLSPKQGVKRIFGIQAAWQGASVLVKAAVVAVLAYGAIRTMMPLLGGLVPTSTVLQTATRSLTGMLRNVGIAGLLLAAADYAYQRRRVGNQIRMTRQEVKAEHKQSEGDPQVRGAIRSHQLALARSRMLADVPQADVVLVNPTHVAVALRYDPQVGAPTVVARGAGVIAGRIRAAATEARVPLVRDVPLARALYRSCRVGQQIPPELFSAVAQVLAFVISRKRLGAAAGEHRSPREAQPLPDVPRHRAAARRRPAGTPAAAPPGPSAATANPSTAAAARR